ncbi:membrane protein [Paenibacillus sp. E194]|jgi:Protein of unknown function (DUF3995)|uniref:DUF3995 domain-containing protein n=1 Tax=Paenibacillus alvei TS-15 TaxID=1117108 RepID=S9TVQ8_PAEAL|nr:MULTISPECIES: DUF3995 domain-containing protein [Paenibacillus]EPY06361.1 hypothetical protein PAALTS15_14466 [Paenibacillus alvei TS-15]KJB84919.1 membrane protein [Paenibacillus sp. E194]
MVSIISLVAACILFLISLLHVYWACRGTWGTSAVIPERNGKRTFSPRPGLTLVIAGLLALAAVMLLIRASYISFKFNAVLLQIGVWICAVVFALRVIGDFNYVGLFKRIKKTRFAKMDTCLYVPLCAFLSLAFLVSIFFGTQ